MKRRRMPYIAKLKRKLSLPKISVPVWRQASRNWRERSM